MARPKVVVFSSASLDGKLSVAPGVLLLFGEERWQKVGGKSFAYERVKTLHQPQATLEGSGSMLTEEAQPEPLPAFSGDPAPLYNDYLPESIVDRPGHKGWFSVVDGRGRIRWVYKTGDAWPGFEGWYLLVLVSHSTPPEYLAYLQREEIPYLVAGDGQVDLALALGKMCEKLGVSSLLSTAGGKLNGALLKAGLVDELNLEFFPALIGGRDTAHLFDVDPLQPGEMPVRLEYLSSEVSPDGYVWLRYQVVEEKSE